MEFQVEIATWQKVHHQCPYFLVLETISRWNKQYSDWCFMGDSNPRKQRSGGKWLKRNGAHSAFIIKWEIAFHFCWCSFGDYCTLLLFKEFVSSGTGISKKQTKNNFRKKIINFICFGVAFAHAQVCWACLWTLAYSSSFL